MELVGAFMEQFSEFQQLVQRVRELEAQQQAYKAPFLWPCEEGSVEQAGYEFANAKTEDYRKGWWNTLVALLPKGTQ